LHVAFTLPVAIGATIAALFSLLLFIAALARCCSRMSPRVTSRPGVRLQAVIAMLKGADLDVALQFVNYR